MSKNKSALNDVATLIDERRQYERWLSALDERRDATPPHVYERVHADYRTRLSRVNEQLATHKGAVNEELSGLRTRLALITAEMQLRSDERAEVELRAAVGELSEGDVKKALKTVGETLDTLQVERSEIDSDIRRLTDFLAATEGQSPQPSLPLGASPAAVPSVSAAVPPKVATPASAPAVAAPPAPPASPPQDQLVTDRSTAEPSPGLSSGVSEPDVRPPTNPSRRSTPFDELGFLSSVVAPESEPSPLPATASGPRLSVVRDDAPPPSILADVRSTSEADGGEAPFATNVPANTPIKLRSSGQLETQKTLKCAECGSMNYPTEWYCERCGAELAAL